MSVYAINWLIVVMACVRFLKRRASATNRHWINRTRNQTFASYRIAILFKTITPTSRNKIVDVTCGQIWTIYINYSPGKIELNELHFKFLECDTKSASLEEDLITVGDVSVRGHSTWELTTSADVILWYIQLNWKQFVYFSSADDFCTLRAARAFSLFVCETSKGAWNLWLFFAIKRSWLNIINFCECSN